MVRGMIAAALLLSFLASSPVGDAVLAIESTSPAFEQTWERTDRPVAELTVSRTWMWGPTPSTTVVTEPYAESPDEVRFVQYFDKSRMEDNGWRASEPPWDVTSGLLVVELISGRMQIGDATFEDRQPAEVNVAGDLNVDRGPTYASLAGVLDVPPLPFDRPVIQEIDRAGLVSTDERLERYGVTIEWIDDVTGHSIAGPFWRLMNSSGTIYVDGEFVDEPLFENPFYATGRPITEAYWANVKVAGTYQDVLSQCFERRCMTYTPDNPVGWKVEAGNVGRHYYEWRYGHPPLPGRLVFDGLILNEQPYLRFFTMEPDGSDLHPLSAAPDAGEARPSLSPDGRRLAVSRVTTSEDGVSPEGGVYVINTATGKEVKIANGRAWVTWSQDGTRMALEWQEHSYGAGCCGGGRLFEDPPKIAVANADGTGFQVLSESRIDGDVGFILEGLPLISPDGSQVVFSREYTHRSAIDEPPSAPRTWALVVMRIDGSCAVEIRHAELTRPNIIAWSSDSSSIVFEYETDQARSESSLFLIAASGGEPEAITPTGVQVQVGNAPTSPDGKWIAFRCKIGGGQNDPWGLCSVTTDGHHFAQLVDPSVAGGVVSLFHFTFSPDSSRLAVETSHNVLVINVDGTDPVTVSAQFSIAGRNLAWSPDGQYLASAADEGIRTVEIATGEVSAPLAEIWIAQAGGGYVFWVPKG